MNVWEQRALFFLMLSAVSSGFEFWFTGILSTFVSAYCLYRYSQRDRL